MRTEANSPQRGKAGPPHGFQEYNGFMRKACLALAAFSLLLVAGPALANTLCGQPICFTFSPEAQQFFSTVGLTQAQVEDRLNLELGRFFQTTDTAGFVRRFGDSQSFTSKGMGVDYASEATLIEVGAAASVAMGIDRTYQPSNSGSGAGFPISGVGLNASLMAGVSLEPLGVPLMLFGNWMRVPERSYGQLTGKLDNWGVHAQLRLFGPSRDMSALNLVARWGGIAITTGLDYSHMNLRAGQKFATGKINFSDLATVPNTAATIDVSGAVDGKAGLELDMLTKSIPLEVTTSLRLFTLLTLYGGVGVDWQLAGGSRLDVKISEAQIRGTVNGSPSNLGTAEVEAQASTSPSSAKLRGILGAQVNLFLLRLFVQLNAANTDPMMASLAVGARVAY